MKKFAILFAALCMVGLFSSESFAQCGGGGYGFSGRTYVGGGGYYGRSYYRPSVGISYGSYRPNYRPYGGVYSRPYYGSYRPYYGAYRAPGCGYRGISIRF